MSVMSAPRLKQDFASVSMDTFVNISVISDRPRAEIEPRVQQAFDWFATVERSCSRFDPSSELMQLPSARGRHVRVSTLLFEAFWFTDGLNRGRQDQIYSADLGVKYNFTSNVSLTTSVLYEARISNVAVRRYRDLRIGPRLDFAF